MAAQSSHGTYIQRAPAATPSTYTTVGKLGNITPPSMNRNTHEVTDQLDADDEVVVGYRRSGELQFDVFLDMGADGTHDESTGLVYSHTNGHLDNWKVIFPDGTTQTFAGYLVGLEFDAPNDGVLTASCTVKPSGARTWS